MIRNNIYSLFGFPLQIAFVNRLVGSIFIVVMLAVPVAIQAQIPRSYYEELEFMVGVGTTHYLGDIGGSSGNLGGIAALYDNLGLDIENSRIALRFGARYIFNRKSAVSIFFSPMMYYGSDKWSSKSDRGLWFNTYILSFNGQYEHYLTNRITGYAPYGFIGTGGLAYWVDAKHFNNRMQRAMDISTGFGLRFPSKTSLTQSVELGFHYYLTDQLDGFRGPIKRNDTSFVLMYIANLEWIANLVYDYKGLIKK